MQRSDWRSGSDTGLDDLFAAAQRELAPEPFTAAVMRSVRRSKRRDCVRVCAIGSALAASVAVAGVTLIDFVPRLSASAAALRGSTGAAFVADLTAAAQMYRVPVLVVLCCALAWPALARLVAR